MSSADKIQLVVLEELSYWFSSKYETDTSFVVVPTCCIIIRITPEQVTNHSLVWNFQRSRGLVNLFYRLEIWAESTMSTKYLFINNGCNWKTFKYICEGFPQFNTIPLFTIVIKTIHPVDRTTLVISSK